MSLQPGEKPRPPRWGHIEHDAAGPVHVFGTTGNDSADEAIEDIARSVRFCGDRDARQLRMSIRPAGTFRGEPASLTFTFTDCDPVFGLTADQLLGVRARLGDGSTAPRIDIVVEYGCD